MGCRRVVYLSRRAVCLPTPGFHLPESVLKYTAKIEERTYSLEITPDGVKLDGEEVVASMRPVGPAGYSLIVDGRSVRAVVEPNADGTLRVTIDGNAHEVEVRDEHAMLMERFGGRSAGAGGIRHVRAPMPGMVRAVNVAEGDTVEEGHGLLVLEAMKMENELRAEVSGVVRAVHVGPGSAVEKNQMLVDIAPEAK